VSIPAAEASYANAEVLARFGKVRVVLSSPQARICNSAVTESRSIRHKVDLDVQFVANHDSVPARQQFRLKLHEMVRCFVGHFPGVLFIDAIMNAAIGEEVMVFEIELIRCHSETQTG
jgi:hypothetical protein